MASTIKNIFTRMASSVGFTPKSTGLRRFDAAMLSRQTNDWLQTEVSINKELQTDLNALRARGRQLVNNNDYARRFRQMVEDNIVGASGFTLQSRIEDKPGSADRLAQQAVENAFADWAKKADITGRLSLREVCRALISAMPSDGEFLVRIVRGADAQNPHNFALQLIDIDRLDTGFNGRYGQNTVVMGVEIDSYSRPLAYHMFAAHPSDGVRSDRSRIRVDALDMIHGFKQERPEQMRGVPWMASGMLSLHHLGKFMTSAVLAAEHGANHYGFFTTPDGNAPNMGADDGSGQTITVSQPGIYDTLPAGTTFSQHESKYPNEVFAPFVKSILQRTASGWGIAYHTLGNDLEGVSYSSIRSGTQVERDRWMADQEWFIDTLLEPVFAAWLQMALLSGTATMPNGAALPAAKAAKFAAHTWQARRWDWVDPQSDMQAKQLAVTMGIAAPQDLAASMGQDFDDVMKKIRDAKELAAQYGITLPAYDAKPGANSGNNSGNNTNSNTGKTN
jgi:lambda family phage portal protein